MKLTNVSLFCLLALSSIVLACGGGGGGGGGTPPGLTVTAVNPSGGPPAGGTAITITGTGFATGATVTVGGAAAANVTVVDDTTITCNTPAGTTGAADVTVTVGGGSATLTGGFTYGATPPAITSVAPPQGSALGGSQLQVSGAGFSVGTATVTVGGAAATSVVVVDDATIQFATPGGAAGSAPVVVTTSNGASNGGPFAYYDPILLADGVAAGPWMLWAFDITSLTVEPIASLAKGITGMDFGPTGVLYGVTTQPPPTGARELVTINPATGVMAVVGPLNDGGGTNYPIPDITFVNATLYGTEPGIPAGPGVPSVVTINPASGLVTTGVIPITAPPAVLGPGGGMAWNPNGTPGLDVYWMTTDAPTSPLIIVDTLTPGILGGPFLAGFGLGGNITAATYHQGQLYVVDAAAGGGPRELRTVATTTGVSTLVAPLGSPVGAAASPTK